LAGYGTALALLSPQRAVYLSQVRKLPGIHCVVIWCLCYQEEGTLASNIVIVGNYRNYAPSVDITRSVQLLLNYVPDEYLSGLNSIELTNSQRSRKLRRGKTWSRKRKVRMVKCRGFYYGDHIELLVDNILQGIPSWAIRWPVSRNV